MQEAHDRARVSEAQVSGTNRFPPTGLHVVAVPQAKQEGVCCQAPPSQTASNLGYGIKRSLCWQQPVLCAANDGQGNRTLRLWNVRHKESSVSSVAVPEQ